MDSAVADLAVADSAVADLVSAADSAEEDSDERVESVVHPESDEPAESAGLRDLVSAAVVDGCHSLPLQVVPADLPMAAHPALGASAATLYTLRKRDKVQTSSVKSCEIAFPLLNLETQ